MADALEECAGIVKDARLQMDAIDREAHEAIQQIIDSQKARVFGGWVALSMIWAVRPGQNGCVGSLRGCSGEHWVASRASSNQ